MASDPTYAECRAHILETFRGLLDPTDEDETAFDIAEAVYWLSADYHGGQWSNLYRAGCETGYQPGRMTSGPEPGSQAEFFYQELEAHYFPETQ